MGKFLAAVGRAQPSRGLQQIINTKLNMEAGERRERLLQSNLALNAEQLAQLQRKGRMEEAQFQKMNTPRPMGEILSTLPGGETGAMAQYAMKYMTRNGYVENIGGIPSVSPIAWQTGYTQAMKDPVASRQFIQVGIDETRAKLSEIEEQKKTKGPDEKLVAAEKELRTMQAGLVEAMRGLNKEFLSLEEKAAKAEKEAAEFELEKRKVAASELRAAKSGSALVNIDMSKKTQATLEEDIMRTTKNIAKFDKMLDMAKPEYFNIPHKTAMKISKVLERGLDVKWKTKEQAQYHTFWKMVRQQSLQERKEFTGVAGGEKEMIDIEKTTSNMGDSYSTFVENTKLRKKMAVALRKRAMYWLSQNIDLRELTPEARAKLTEEDPLNLYGWEGEDVERQKIGTGQEASSTADEYMKKHKIGPYANE